MLVLAVVAGPCVVTVAHLTSHQGQYSNYRQIVSDIVPDSEVVQIMADSLIVQIYGDVLLKALLR